MLSGARSAVIKARVVRRAMTPGALAAHVRYLQRDGVTKDGAAGCLFSAEADDLHPSAFVARCADDRHHFRFIVSPDDAHQLADLRRFTRELMSQAEHDLATRLDWVAVDHWNTEHPHIHVIVRGKADDGRDLVISRDYISHGMRARAGALVTQELGPRPEHDIRRELARQVEAERWTRLDGALAREVARQHGLLDLRRSLVAGTDPLRTEKIARLRKLERLGLAHGDGRGCWTLVDDAQAQLRALGAREDIIKRLHRTLTADGRAADPSLLVLEGETNAALVGRLAARGLDDELKGSAYAIVDGIDGRAHHLRLPTLDAVGDGPIGSIVELRRFLDASGRDRIALAVRSDFAIERQVTATGATWLDRQLIAREPAPLGTTGFAAEVRDALSRRTEQLVNQGLARHQEGRFLYARDLLTILRRRELADAADRLAAETGLPHMPIAEGEHVGGVYRQQLRFASGRFAMLDDGLGFQLVPWSPSLERRLGQRVDGVGLPGGGVEWSFGRKRSLSL